MINKSLKLEVMSLPKNKSEETRESSEVAKAFFVFAMCIVLLFNLLGNSMVLCVVYHRWKHIKQRVTNSLIVNLACIDLLCAILVVFAIVISIRGSNEMSYTKCQLDGFLSNLVGASSILTMAVIAIDRYLVIVLSHHHRLKLMAARAIIACVWMIAIVMALFPILFWGKYHQTEKSTQCKPKSRGYILLLAIVCFVIPLATMIFCYISVFLKVRRHKQLMVSTLRRKNCNFKTEFKTTKIVFTVLATFIALWLPYVIVYVTSSVSGKDTFPPAVFKFCGFLTAMHSMCNPIIYFTMNVHYRRAAIHLLRKIFSCVLPANENSATSESVSCEMSCSAKQATFRASTKSMPVQVSTNTLLADSKDALNG